MTVGCYLILYKKKQVPILGIVLGVIAAIVLVGLALLMLWKMATTIHDRREFARFEKERMMAKWDTVSSLATIINGPFRIMRKDPSVSYRGCC